jgi:hypothetical protein
LLDDRFGSLTFDGLRPQGFVRFDQLRCSLPNLRLHLLVQDAQRLGDLRLRERFRSALLPSPIGKNQQGKTDEHQRESRLVQIGASLFIMGRNIRE